MSPSHTNVVCKRVQEAGFLSYESTLVHIAGKRDREKQIIQVYNVRTDDDTDLRNIYLFAYAVLV